jgi:hypothetical protein
MNTSPRRPGWPVAARLGVALTSLGGTGIVAGWLVAAVVADHSSSDSSPSSLIAVALGLFGFFSVLLGVAIFAGSWAVARAARLGHRDGPPRSGSR